MPIRAVDKSIFALTNSLQGHIDYEVIWKNIFPSEKDDDSVEKNIDIFL